MIGEISWKLNSFVGINRDVINLLKSNHGGKFVQKKSRTKKNYEETENNTA